jgi:hypothetical protein
MVHCPLERLCTSIHSHIHKGSPSRIPCCTWHKSRLLNINVYMYMSNAGCRTTRLRLRELISNLVGSKPQRNRSAVQFHAHIQPYGVPVSLVVLNDVFFVFMYCMASIGTIMC